MADVDPNLVKAIAEQVLAAIQGASAGVGSPAEIHAPIGQCTGDYSKFPELKNLQSAPGPVAGTVSAQAPVIAPAMVPQASAALPPVTSLKGVITVSHLRSIKGPIRLAKGTILTPLAQDYIKEKNLNVMTDEQAVPTKMNAGPAPVNAPTFWWIEGQCSSVAKVIESLRPNVLASRERSSAENLRSVVKELAGLVKAKKVAAGLLFVQSAARASVYANRCHSLRAIVGTSDKAVSDGIEQLGANVLIVEYPLHGFKSMSALIAPFLASMHQMPEPVRKELNELTACG